MNHQAIKEMLKYYADVKASHFSFAKSGYGKTVHGVNDDILSAYIELDEILKRVELTKRQRELLNLICNGYSVRDIVNEFPEFSKSSTYRMFSNILKQIEKQYKK